ncbi:hypothetical protein [Microbulbifer sp. SAOS-129_SWC]|uniref:hypothetical protein n=1 Tax=Microbulbifer sp. SAOS-129_SWC TaxID=3145235 RepID=UPI003216EB0B
MRTLHLHIGLHKTGTSSLQLALKRRQSTLMAQGVEFACLGKKGNSSGAIEVCDSDTGLAFHLSDRFEAMPALGRGGQQDLIRCLQQTAALSPHKKSWLDALRRSKRKGR